MAKSPEPNWVLLTQAIYPNLNAAEREALSKTWTTNYANFAPLKEQWKEHLRGSVDPDPVFDLLGEGSLGDGELGE